MLPCARVAIGGAGVLGLGGGSFLNVVILRGHSGETLGGRWGCPHCKKNLSAKELVPLLSFLLQRGRCLHCGTALSLQYPLVEAGTAITFGGIAWYLAPLLTLSFSSLATMVAALIIASAAIVILVSDL